jgi:trk system potassium uptake protein TrkH
MATNRQISLFEASSLAFSTISTGGFTIHNNGMAYLNNVSTQWVSVCFMILGSLNFSLYFYALRGKFYRLYDPELFLYLFTLLIGCLLMTLTLWRTPQFGEKPLYFSIGEAFTQGVFQAVSAQTSTGLTLANYDLWPSPCIFLMILLMYIGGMSGSTTGGIKTIRFAILFRAIKHRIESIFRPESIRCLMIGNKVISDKTLTNVLLFFCVSIAIVIFGIYLLVLDQQEPMTALGIISCMVNNTGLALGGIGSMGSFAYLSPFSKIVSILWMLLGRLEYFTILVLLTPAFWKSR